MKPSPKPSPIGRLRALLWDERVLQARHHRVLMRCGRYTYAVVRDLLAGDLSLRAMSLVYTTLLSIVPLLALGFSVLKALGAHNSLEPVLAEFLRPLGPQAAEISAKVMAFIEKIQVGVLSSVGVALLFYTAISLIQKVESSFNFIWRIEHQRPFAQRIGEYFGVLMVGPVLVFAALGLTASVLNSGVVANIASYQPFGWLIYLLTRVIPYLIIVGLFSFMYSFLVNAKVRWSAALAGGLTAGVLWQTGSLLFASFVANASNYNAVYSSFAIVIFLLIWIYVGWLVLLIGCQLAFYVQNPRHLDPSRRATQIAGREAEYLALTIMALAAQRFIGGDKGLTQDDLIDGIDAPPENVTHTIEALIECEYLIESGPARALLLPARDPAAIYLGAMWRSLRSHGMAVRVRGPLGHSIAALLDSAEICFDAKGGDLNLRDWLMKQTPAETAE
ncbi:MAG: YihY/virulence factor BrkB family protein [Hydrocarboniphaga sp.]|uniref:YihY/virulence factor BrkB family protein n=1 Tax=Hydrocarboniphaga sp. TaxID=2033016 RepID=UPI0026050DF2|nr:YihY/virulence factor BrkB family protein [Hydrocarboniphaga sp.]MDB5971914.1 YihY/virulence factor BrkB family protein [Hydrocarboniphaga sp.]